MSKVTAQNVKTKGHDQKHQVQVEESEYWHNFTPLYSADLNITVSESTIVAKVPKYKRAVQPGPEEDIQILWKTLL